jgi:hypothetical protein
MSSIIVNNNHDDDNNDHHSNHHYFNVQLVARKNKDDNSTARHSFGHNNKKKTNKKNDNNNYYGCFARCDIPRHTIIYIETSPLLCGELLETALQRHESGQHGSQADDDMFLQANEQSVSVQQRYWLWQMHDQYIDHYCNQQQQPTTTATTTSIQKEKRIWGIFYSNAFYNDDMQSSALYYVASKFNHSCSPNVGYDCDGWKMRLWTTRLVHQGEELFDCYSDVVYHQPIEKRRLYLYTKYLFWCTCPKCCHFKEDDNDQEDDDHHHPNDTTEQSDNRRLRLQQIAKELYQQVDGAEILYSPELEQEVDRIVMIQENYHPDYAVVETLRQMDRPQQYHHQHQQQQQQQQQYNSDMKKKKKKSEPKPRHLDLLLEYLDLLQQEGLDHDTLDVWQLAYELATFLNATHILHHYQLPQRCWHYYQLHKGENHPQSQAFFVLLQQNEL